MSSEGGGFPYGPAPAMPLVFIPHAPGPSAHRSPTMSLQRSWSRSFASLLAVAALWASAGMASAQSLPVNTTVSGNTATVIVGSPTQPIADLTITFDDATGLSASSLGVSAKLVDITDATLLARLTGALTQPDSAFPL